MGYKYLSANRRNKLTVAEKQQLNGNDVIKLAGSGSLYLQQCVSQKVKVRMYLIMSHNGKHVCIFMLNL